MNTERREPRIPDIVLERYRLRELADHERAQIAAALHDDEDLRRRVEALERADMDLRDAGALDQLAARIAERRASRATRPGSARWWSWPAGLAAAAAAILLVVVVPGSRIRLKSRAGETLQPGATASRNAVDDRDDRIKGLRPSLAVYRRTHDGTETLADGAVAHQGDLLRVAYRAAGHSYGLILSIDGRGSVTLHLPPSGERAAALKRDATVLLDESYELDDAPLWERFYFVTGDTPFAAAPIVEAARHAAFAANHQSPPAALPLPRGLEQTIFSVQKANKQ